MVLSRFGQLKSVSKALHHARVPVPSTRIRYSSDSATSNNATSSSSGENTSKVESSNFTKAQASPKKKSVLQQDEELRQKLNAANGDAGVEYEDGQPASMKRSVKNNMFRYI